MSDVEVDEHAITRKVLSKRWGHVRGVGWQVKGIGSSSSIATSHSPSRSRYFSHTSANEVTTSQAEASQATARATATEASMRRLVSSLQSQLPNIYLLEDLFVAL